MSLKKESEDNFSGFLHSQAGLNSADPNVQFYKNHHDRISGKQSSFYISGNQSSFYGPAAVVFLVVVGIGAAVDRIGRAFSGAGDTIALVVLVIVGLGLLIGISSLLNRFLVNYRRAAIAVFLFLFLFLAAYSVAEGTYRVYATKEYWTLASYFSVRSPLNTTSAGPGSIGFAVLACLVALIPWIRRNFKVWKAALAALVVMISPFIIGAIVRSFL
jgi:hypothetical protein